MVVVLSVVLILGLMLAVKAQPQQGSLKEYQVTAKPLADGSRASFDLVQKTAQAALGMDWDTTAVSEAESNRDFRLMPKPDKQVARNTAAAWSGVQRLHATGVFEYVAPLFDESTAAPPGSQPWYGECQPGWSDSSTPEFVDDALNDSTWSLGPKGANVFEAWKLPTQYGKDIVVAHPDTGYLLHPSITPALLGRGFNFPARFNDALDTAEDGVLQWAGHGTRTASVIAGRQYQLAKYWISGVAPAAQIMPLKVAHRVVLLDWIETDMEQLAIAIRAAAIGDPNFVRRKADIITMSLGGYMNENVKKALDLAEANNVIVLAAAGNYPGTLDPVLRQVVYPARYDNVIAVAASNIDGRNWPHSADGRAVAFAAPGQNVWTAKYRRVGETTHHCIEPSSGTSYAVATTAGVAALWLSYHREALSKRPDIDRPRLFKTLTSCTASKINDHQDTSDYGGGIINARALLDEPLPLPDGPAPDQSDRCRTALREVPPRPLR
jgi:thermitase